MSTVTKAISSVEFHVNARQANAALQSIQEEAKRCRQQVEELQEQAAKGVTTVKVDGMDVDIQKRIREVKALQKTWESAAQSQIKGAKAFDELWKNARMGTIESMNGAQIKAGINASKPIYDRLRLGDAEDRMKAQAIKDIQDQGQKVLNQLKTTTDQIIKQIADGETIAADVLEREARNLKSIMDLLPPLSQEWKDYNLQYQAINQQIERQTVLERQLRGEIVTREDAIRVINAANREATQQEIAQEEQRAKAAREAAEAKASEADQYRTTVEQKQSEIFATNDLIAAKRREIDTHHESAAAAKEAADKARDAAYKDRKQAEQEARNQQDAYNKQKKIRDDAAKDVEKFRKELEKLGPVEQKEAQNTEELTRLQEEYNQKVERRKQLEQELDAIKARSLEDDPHVKQLREEISTLDELIAVSDKYRKQFAKMSDTAFEKGYMGKTGLEDERTSVFRAEDYLKRAYRDKMKAGVADMKPDDPEYQDAAKRVAGGIVQNAQENLRRAIFNEIKGGELSSKALEEKIETYRNMMGQAAREAYSLKDDPEYNTYKYIIAQMEKYLDVARQVEAERQKIAGNEPFMKATQSDVLNDVFGDSLIHQRDKRVFDELTAGRPFREKQEQDEATAKRELKKAQDEESESFGRLNKAKKESAEQTSASNEQDEKRAGVQQKLADAETRLADENRKLNEQADKTITANQQAAQAANEHQQSVKALGDVMEENRKTGQRLGEEMGELTKQHKQQTEELAEASEKMTDAEKESNRHIKTEQEARLRIQQLNNQSIEQLTASLRVLEEENRRINDPGNQRWQENERYIGQLNLRLEELKKQSAELRREPVLDMMTQRMQSLSTLSRDALAETKKFWEQMVDGAQKGSTELADYEQHLKSIALEEQARVREQGREAFAFFQREDYRRTNAADTEEQRKALVAYRDALPADATDRIEAINALLEKQAQFVKEAAGEWMSLEKAMELAKTAGTDQFAGSAKDIQLATQSLERQRDTIIATIREKRNLGQATKAEEDQLADLTKKLRSLKFEQDNVNMSQEKMRTLIETPANAVNLDELRAAIKRADGQLRQMEQSLGQNSDEYKRFAEQVRQAKNVMKEMEGQSKATTGAFDQAISRLKSYVGVYLSFNIALQKVTAVMDDMMTLSDKMGEVRKTTGFTADEVGRLSDNLAKLDTRTNLTGLMEFSSLAGSIGLKTQEAVQGFTEAANMIAVSLPEMGNEASRTLMKIADATGDLEKNGGDVRETLERVGSTIIALRANSAAAAGPITDFVSRVGAVGAQAGISIDQIAALGATVDALGGRVEMSATALSRMIPAIKNNSFAVAQAIGMTEKELKGKTGMEQMVAIFHALHDSVKGFDTSTEEGMNAMADSVEKALGRSASMQEVMKQLNQQGARAGIVFGLLSQNVDKLEEQLGTAATAYRENTALANEYENMNETFAAKWERLKNQLEEMFVSDSMQRFFSNIVDGLRTVVDLISGPLNTAFGATVIAFSAIKIGLTEIPSKIGGFFDYLKESAEKAGEALSKAANSTSEIADAANDIKDAGDAVSSISDALGDAQEAGEQAGEAMKTATGAIEGMTGATKVSIFSIKGLKSAWQGLNTTMKANIIVAAAAALYALGKAVYDWLTQESAAEKAMAKVDTMVDQEVRKFERYNKTLTDTSVALVKATKNHRALSEELDRLRQSTDGSAEATAKLKAKEDELRESEEKVSKASNDHKKAINEINNIYGKYLNFILTEANYANLAAAAHDKVTAAIMREMLEKQRNAALDEIYAEHREDLEDEYKDLSKKLKDSGLSGEEVAMAKQKLQSILQEVIQDVNSGKTVLSAEQGNVLKAILGEGWKNSKALKDPNLAIGLIYNAYLQNELGVSVEGAQKITGVYLEGKKSKNTGRSYYSWTTDGGNDYVEEYLGLLKDLAESEDFFKHSIAAATKKDEEKTVELLKKSSTDLENALSQIGNIKYGGTRPNEETLNKVYDNLAVAVENIEKNIEAANQVGDEKLFEELKQRLDDVTAEADAQMLQAARDRINIIYSSGSTVTTPTTTTKPYGDYNKVTDDYSKWNGNDLVARRKEMLERVKALANGADVQAVLSEDAKFISEAVRNNIKTTEQAIEWYNEERLKIQEALYNKHLTPTGDWLDPKKGAGNWRKLVQNDFDTYLKILDAYYTERKAHIQEAIAEEGLSEAEAQRLTIENETVWRKHRMELQQIYQGKSEKIAKEERQRIYDILAEQDEDSAEMVEKTIMKSIDKMKILEGKSEVEYRKIMSKLTKDIANDLYKQQNAVAKQMEAITAIIAKERPFNGLTENLQKNLSTMGILFADFDKIRQEAIAKGLEPEDDMTQRAEQTNKRLLLLLDAAEDAYSITWEQLKERMQKEGLGDWASTLEVDEQKKQAVIASLHSFYDSVQDAIKKEASLMKKQAENMWNNILLPGGDGKTTIKDAFEQTISTLGIEQGRVSRANSLIGAGQASERVADRLAIQQMKVQMAMQQHYYNLIKKQGRQRIDDLDTQIKKAQELNDLEKEKQLRLDKQHVEMSLNLALTKEQTDILKQQEDIIARTEESEARLYKDLRSWADLLTSSLQGVFDASHAGDAEYYNERAKLNLTGKGGPGAGTYVVIDDAGTSDATAHYEYLDERQALERQHEIEVQNAQAEAWRKLMDDLNMKMSEQITDWLNAAAQNASVDANTDATLANTVAIVGLTAAMGGKVDTSLASGLGYEPSGNEPNTTIERIGYEAEQQVAQAETTDSAPSIFLDPNNVGLIWEQQAEAAELSAERQVGAIDKVKVALDEQFHKQEKGSKESSQKMTSSAQSAFAKMTAAANLYGIAYQAMSNDNLSTAQKFSMMAIQAAGQSAITALTVDFSKTAADATMNSTSVLGKLWSQLGWGAVPVYAIFTGLLGGLMGLAASKVAKSKSEIAQATGTSVGAGRLATGMLTYADGNVNELTDPASLTPGRQYNVDGADGKTYRARYMGKGAKTHITNGPEFHLVGEAGREAIIDAKTTRLLQLNETGIWRDIQTLYNGGSISGLSSRRRRGGVRAFADGNVGEFEDMADGGGLTAEGTGGMNADVMTSMLETNSRLADLLENALVNGIKAVNKWTGSDGIPAMYNKMQKEAQRHGEKYL